MDREEKLQRAIERVEDDDTLTPVEKATIINDLIEELRQSQLTED